MSKKSKNVGVADSTVIAGKRVGEYMQQKFEECTPRFVLSYAGHAPYGPRETTSYQFVTEPVAPSLGNLFNLFKPSSHREIGGIWFSNEGLRASHGKWVLLVYGRQYLDFFTELAEDLTEKFKVKIHVRLESENSRQVIYGCPM